MAASEWCQNARQNGRNNKARKAAENGGAGYKIRTRDPLITNRENIEQFQRPFGPDPVLLPGCDSAALRGRQNGGAA